MIHFFRRIRQGLISQERIGKYVLYAVGEIVLVMIGILLALQVNNWNEQKKLESSEKLILKDLQEAMVQNIDQLEKVIEEDKKSYEASTQLKELVENPLALNNTSDSSFASLVHRMNVTWTFNPDMGLINSIVSSGKLEIISNESIRKGVASLEDKISDANEAQGYLVRIRTDLLFDIWGKSYAQGPDGKYFLSKDKLVGSEYFFWLMNYGGIHRGLLNEEEDLLKFIKDLLAQINQSLDD